MIVFLIMRDEELGGALVIAAALLPIAVVYVMRWLRSRRRARLTGGPALDLSERLRERVQSRTSESRTSESRLPDTDSEVE